jgi:hypothetical protein
MKDNEYDDPPPRSRGYDDDDDDLRDVRRPRSAAGKRIIVPAACMLGVASLGIILAMFNIVVALTQAPAPPDPNMPPFMQEVMKGAHGPMAAVIQGFMGLCSLITILGSIQMLRLKSWGLGVFASVLSIINFASCCCILGAPFGI